jgi:hypothetical protein
LRAALLAHAFAVPCVLVACCALGACGRARVASVRVEARRLDGPRPAQWALRCRSDGLKPPVALQWRFSAGVKQVGPGVPSDEPVVLLQPPERGLAWAECAATGADGVIARGARSLAALSVSAAPATAKAGELVTVRGGGFGPSPSAGDGIWLVPSWGAALPADGSCKGAAWSDGAVSACVPAGARGRAWQVRVQISNEVALAPKPLVVAP